MKRLIRSYMRVLALSAIGLFAGCSSTAIENPVIDGVLNIESHPDTEMILAMSFDTPCDIIGQNCEINYSSCETALRKEQAAEALEYYQKALTRAGWRGDKDGFFWRKDNRGNKTKLRLTTVEPYKLDPRICFQFSEYENHKRGQSDIILALREFREIHTSSTLEGHKK